MRRLLAPLTLLLLLLTAACGRGSATTSNTGAAANKTPADQQAASKGAGWTRPMDVTPLSQPLAVADSAGGKVPAGEGKFTVISNTPWPGEKVRVFFFGVQG